jgi:small subunit ribosomal protein S3Ae
MQSDLAPNQDTFHWRKIKLIVDHIEGRQALTSFYGVDTTRDELCSLIKKRKTLIDAIQDTKSLDGYVLRVFAIAFTKESPNQKSKTNYAQSSQQKAIRRKINEIIAKEISKANATDVLKLFTSDVVEKKITKEVSHIYPVKNVKVRKIKVIQRPKVDATKLSEFHDPEKRILTHNVKRVTKKGRVERVVDTEAVNLVHQQ